MRASARASFVVACLVGFYLAGIAGAPIGIPCFLWIGVFDLMIVAQLWPSARLPRVPA
jgi:hypothetical protein